MKKIYSIFYFAALFLAIGFLSSCSKDDDADITPSGDGSLEEATFSLSESGTDEIIEIPENMLESDDPYAAMAVAYINSINQMTTNTGLFNIPEGAEKSSTPIASSSGRTKATNGEYLVYTWTYDNQTIAYQLSSSGDKYIWEIYIKMGSEDYNLFVYAEENKSAKKGLMKIFYDAFTQDGTSTDPAAIYTWDIDNESLSTASVEIPAAGFKYVVEVDADLSGNVKYYLDGEIYYHMIWESNGSGTWTYYEDGESALTGTWTV